MKLNPIKILLINGIKIYQRHLSPKKGYSCPYRLVHGGSGCSGVGYRLIRRYGAFQGLLLLRKRFKKCAYARHQLYNQSTYFALGIATKQSGHGDCRCDEYCKECCTEAVGRTLIELMRR